ncbi:hypothetical protein IEC33019_1088 [Pseudomonas putida]|uniref:Uncharacterized protein n=1 Tax=Pseudomonas putida TaxID=303 RepID=A0A1B2F303_PSEPU|nr:hypothetical protein IEC33019_1088 [Pseudomonas putida]
MMAIRRNMTRSSVSARVDYSGFASAKRPSSAHSLSHPSNACSSSVASTDSAPFSYSMASLSVPMPRGIAKKHWRTWSGSLCSRKWYSVNFCGSLFYSMFREYDSLYVGVIIFAISISIYMVFYSRHSIASLRALRRQEASEGCRYTFMDIEGIREKRAASLLGRLFAIKPSR